MMVIYKPKLYYSLNVSQLLCYVITGHVREKFELLPLIDIYVNDSAH